MKKFMKKLIVTCLAVCMAVSCIVPYTFAAEVVQPEVIGLFQTMEGWQKADGLDLPEGLTVLENRPEWSQYIINANAGGSNTMAIESAAANQYPYIQFSETITTGVIHMSFDMSFPAENMPALLLTAFANTANNNVNDLRDTAGTNYDNRCIAAWNAGGSGYFGSAPDINSYWGFGQDVEMTTLAGWHKYDLFFDMESREISYYMDGTPLCDPQSYEGFTGFKGVALRFETAGGNPLAGIYLDNLYLHHYQKDGAGQWDDIRLGADTDAAQKTVALAFSEAVELGDVVLANDFIIENTVTGDTVVPSEAVIIDTGVQLRFNEIPSGEYEVSISEEAKTAYTGSISGKTVDSKAIFTISGNAIDQETAQRYYINEDFESYKGGLPAGWAPVNADLSTNIAQGGQNRAEGQDGGSALELNTAGMYTYEFDKAIKSGKMTVEFDVKTDNGGWGFSLLNEADMIGADRVPMHSTAYTAVTDRVPTVAPQSTRYAEMRAEAQAAAEEAEEPFDEDAWRTANWQTLWDAHIKDADDPDAAADRALMTHDDRWRTLVVGNTTAASTDVYYNSDKWSWFGAGTYPDVTFELGSWHHVKLEIDIEGRTMTATLDGVEQEPTNFISRRFGLEPVYDTENGWTEYLGGVKAIGIVGYNTGSAYYDNIRVYTDNSLNVNMDFDSMTPSGRHPSVYKADTPDQNIDNVGAVKVVTVDRDSDDETDKALHISSPRAAGVSNAKIMIPFNIPLNGLRPLTVEFDVKTGDEPWDAFTMDLVTSDDLCAIQGYNSGTTTPNVTYDSHSVFTTVLDDGSFGKLDQYPFRFAFNHPWAFDNVTNAEGATCSLQPDTWYSIKFHMTPGTEGEVYYQAEIRQEGSETVFETTARRVENNAAAYYQNGIAGVMFQQPRATRSYGDGQRATLENPAEFWIDNVKVYEDEGTVFPAEILSATVNNLDGTSETLGDTVTNQAESITLKFSQPISGTDGISMYYPETNTPVQAAYTLSNNNKNVNITFTEPPAAGENITLAVSNQLQTAGSYAGGVEASSFTFQYQTVADGGINVTEFRLYEYVEGRGEGSSAVEGAWVPVMLPDLTGYTELPDLRFVISGFNSAAEEKAFDVFIAGYDEANDQMTSVSVSEQQAPSGAFTVSVDVDETQIASMQDMLKAFVWEKDTMRPLAECLDYALGQGGTETQN